MTTTLDYIKAIASLWPFAVCITILYTLKTLREPITRWMMLVRRFKGRGVELELDSSHPLSIKLNSDKADPEDSPTPVSPDDEKNKAPDDESPLDLQIIIALLEKRIDDAKEALEKWDLSEPDKKFDHKVHYHIYYCLFRIDGSALEELTALLPQVEDKKKRIEILDTIGSFYRNTDQPSRALETYERVRSEAANQAERANSIVNTSKIYLAQTNLSEAMKVLENFIRNEKHEEDGSFGAIYIQMAEVFKAMGFEMGRCAALEKAIESRPTDESTLFDAAYAQSANDLSLLAFYNYKKRLGIGPNNPATMNNYAVELKNLNLPGKSVKFYKKAKDEDHTLAMANIAYLYIEGGFYDEAEEILTEARKQTGYHANVDKALTSLKDKRSIEDERWEKLSSAAAIFQLDFRGYSDGIFRTTTKRKSFEGEWTDEHGLRMTVHKEDLKISAEWGAKPKRKKFSGVILNSSAVGEYSEEDNNPFSYLTGSENSSSFGTARNILIWLDPSGDILTFTTYHGGSDEPTRAKFFRLSPQESLENN